MIDEDELRTLLTRAAETVPPPGRAPQALLDAIAEQAAVPPRRFRPSRRTTLLAAACLAVVALVGVALVREPSADRDAALSSSDDALRDTAQEGGAGAGDGGAAGGTGGTAGGAHGLQDAGTKYASPTEPAPLAPAANPATGASSDAGRTGSVGRQGDSAKVIRTGSLDLEVRKGTFQATVERITAQVVGLGGYVSEATTSESGESPSGSIAVRVPGDSFDQLMTDLRELGDVKAVTAKGTDVTAQFTDLAARLRALTATRDRLHTVLAEADRVPDILAVQDRITAVQVEIEQVQGEQKRLKDQTDYGTIAITLGEPGAEIIQAEPDGDGGLGQAWDDARRRFGDSVEAIVSWSGSAAVALVVGLVGLLALRVAWVGMRRLLV